MKALVPVVVEAARTDQFATYAKLATSQHLGRNVFNDLPLTITASGYH
jgi:hypothetical protein